MNLSDIPGDPGRQQNTKRRGRGEGSGLGKSAGKGNKGQKARAGNRKMNIGGEGGQMPMYRRVPKRGFQNPFRKEYAVVNLSQLNALEDGSEVDAAVLYEMGLVRPKGTLVKILGEGELTRKLTIKADAFSGSARQKIEAAGGSAQVI